MVYENYFLFRHLRIPLFSKRDLYWKSRREAIREHALASLCLRDSLTFIPSFGPPASGRGFNLPLLERWSHDYSTVFRAQLPIRSVALR